jgi:AraC family transcriptional regulator of adaptative response/methylated-DNA-[protein]-cysteine methyltransferase
MKPLYTDPFERISDAIGYIVGHVKDQPNLDVVAKSVGLSSFHFQRLFTAWAGTSPKNFAQYLSLSHAKKLLKEDCLSLLETSIKIGLSGPSRLHDLFVTIEGMTPGEYKNGGEYLVVHYSFSSTPFGKCLIASTKKGICYMAFVEEKNTAFLELQSKFPQATFVESSDSFQKNALRLFTNILGTHEKIPLHIKGTGFQLKVWETLLTIPVGGLSTYGTIAQKIGTPNASRAVGTAVGANPVAFLIPCHRVIQSTGIFGNYHWGPARKAAMIGWEGVEIFEKKQ